MNDVVSGIKKLSHISSKTLPFSPRNSLVYGSKAWSNAVLRASIKELNNVDRVLSARSLEVFYFLAELEKHGFRWQNARLRNHINLAVKRGRFTLEQSESDPKEVVGGAS
ncbi:hypothetical protein MUP01_07020 [Candidatus Bathyarchaeota archaeon]|nr:hypothetical protein [Candidatus Bathyarchaeota archaeon]